MPIRVYDIAKKLGLENQDVISKAKALGITAVKVASSSVDAISAEYLEGEILKDRPDIAARLRAPVDEPHSFPIAMLDFSSKRPEISISVTGEAIYNLVKRILDGEVQTRFAISESEGSEPLSFHLVKDAADKLAESKTKTPSSRVEIDERTKDVLRAAYYISKHKAADGWINLADYGNAVKHEDPSLQPQKFGERSLGSLLRRIETDAQIF